MKAIDPDEIIRFARGLTLRPKAVDDLHDVLCETFSVPHPPRASAGPQGRLITFDGHSGTGKDTQIALLKQRIEAVHPHLRVECVILKRCDPFRTVSKRLWEAGSGEADAVASFLLVSAGRKHAINPSCCSWPIRNAWFCKIAAIYPTSPITPKAKRMLALCSLFATSIPAPTSRCCSPATHLSLWNVSMLAAWARLPRNI